MRLEQLVEVLEVDVAERPPPELAGFALQLPGTGSAEPVRNGATYDLDVAGWAVGRAAPVDAVEIGDAVTLRRLPVDRRRPDIAAAHAELSHAETSGFAGALGLLSFPPRFELALSAVFEEQARIPLARIRGRRATLRSSFEPKLQPAMVTTMGRSGSTVLVRVLDAHPQIVAYRPLEYEPRVSSYWIEMMRTLAEPASYRLQMVHGTGGPGWWLGADQPVPPRRGDTDTLDWLGSAGVEALAGFCQSRIDAFYARHAEHEGRPDAVYFAEKFFHPHVAPLMRELYPLAREIVLVRDFRDMVASMLAYDAKRGARGLAAGNFRTEADFVRRIGGSVERFRGLWERGDDAYLLRYEDLIQGPQETIAALLDHLQLDAGERVREGMVSTIFEDNREVLLHRTTAARDASIGRWRTDLDEQLQRTCQEVLGPALEAFGYPP